ncbi:hypothetical protein GGF44_002598 [Coemansia sp. RSA 1694]|nr:hypothetical protein GGF44_002598 [Coemansia sp. RSA 1694]
MDACRECGNIACAADALPGTQPPVAYASDESSDEEEAEEEEEDPKDDDRDGLGLGPAVLRSSRNSSSNIATPARPQSPPLPPVQSVLRQRTGLGVVGKPSASAVTKRRTTAEESAIIGRSESDVSLVACAALAVMSLAVFLPVRRLAVGGTTVERWLRARTADAWAVDGNAPNKSVLALLALLVAAALCVAAGVALAGLLIPAK